MGSRVRSVDERGPVLNALEPVPDSGGQLTATVYDTTGHPLITTQLGVMERVNLSPLRVSYWA
jgi:hypothetical protein